MSAIRLAPQFEEAQQEHIEPVEAEADRRGVLGVDEPVFQGGRQLGVRRKYSDTLLMFRLNALAPERYKYRDQIAQATTVKAQVAVRTQNLSPDQRRARAIQTVARLREVGILDD